LIGREFEIRTDHRPLVGLLEKPLLSIENQHLCDLVEPLAEFKYKVTYTKGEDNVFPDYLSRNSIEELYEYPEFKRIKDSTEFEVLCFTKEYRKRYIFAGERRSVHSSGHFGYTKMLEQFKEMKVICSGLSQDIMKFLSNCICALTKNNRRRELLD
jgi:hypothetical protein